MGRQSRIVYIRSLEPQVGKSKGKTNRQVHHQKGKGAGAGEQTAERATCKSTGRSTRNAPWPRAPRRKAPCTSWDQNIARKLEPFQSPPASLLLACLVLFFFIHSPLITSHRRRPSRSGDNGAPRTCIRATVYVIHRPPSSVATTPNCRVHAPGAGTIPATCL